MRRTGILPGGVATILVAAGFLLTVSAQFSISSKEIWAKMLRDVSVGLKQTFDELTNMCLKSNVSMDCLWKSYTPFCCPLGNPFLRDDRCVFKTISEALGVAEHDYSISIQPLQVQWRGGSSEASIRNPCHGFKKYYLQAGMTIKDLFKFLPNDVVNKLLDDIEYYKNFCVALIDDSRIYNAVICVDDSEHYDQAALSHRVNFELPFGMMLSVLFFLLTFLVYSLIPELRNIHGYTLRGYIGSTIVAYSSLAYVQLASREDIPDCVCILIAFITYFSFLSSFFWLNVMCFDIWWTFSGLRSIRGTVKQEEKNTFIRYSIYAWGSASLLTGGCVIMEYAPTIPRGFIRPQFGVISCFFIRESAKALYLYVPIGITVMCNICLFILTTMKIIQQKKDTGHHLKGIDSQRHHNNKQWFHLYLKLFIVMGINWSTEIISWFFDYSPEYVWYLPQLVNTLQGVFVFIIFVWKDKTKKLLLTRLGLQKKFLIENFKEKRLLQAGLKDRDNH